MWQKMLQIGSGGESSNEHYLFKNGLVSGIEWCASGSSTSSYTMPVYGVTEGSILNNQLVCNAIYGGWVLVGLNNPISLKGYSKLKFEGTYNGDATARIIVSKYKNCRDNSYDEYNISSLANYELDLGKYQDTEYYYIGLTVINVGDIHCDVLSLLK